MKAEILFLSGVNKFKSRSVKGQVDSLVLTDSFRQTISFIN